MSEKTLRYVFILGSLFFLVVLIGMTFNSLSQVTAARTSQLNPQVVSGKQIWQSKNCNDCHTILGIGGYFAPELTKVYDRRGAEWLQRWLTDPQAVEAGVSMPNQQLDTAEAASLVAFLQWVGKVDTNNWPPQPLAALGGTGGQPSGALLFRQKGCSGCHMIQGLGASRPGPDLSHIASQPYDGLPNTPEFFAKWLEDPQAYKPGTIHPRIPMDPADRSALVQFLSDRK